MIEWQHAVAVVMGAVPSSPVQKREAFRLLHSTGIAYSIGGKIADATREIAASEGWEKNDGQILEQGRKN
jgi:ABC-type tungstate transport system substrate-binding protein